MLDLGDEMGTGALEMFEIVKKLDSEFCIAIGR
jgi:hypothetical protein